jgi:cytoskeleton-associated protein 5
LSTFLEDLNPALVNTINGEFDKVATQAAPEPTRESADWAEIEQASGGAAGGSDALDELNPRMDLNKIVASTTVLKDAKSDSWKERKAAFEALNAELERNSRLKPEMGELHQRSHMVDRLLK